MTNISNNSERGAVSIFVVVFAALLITVITVSFIRLMINDQNQATNNDLSQSAYDSAQAGVEDGKRALLAYVQRCQDEGEAACNTLTTALNNAYRDENCNEVLRTTNIIDTNDEGEVLIQQDTSSNDDVLNQAYTCVLIQLQTEDYLGTLANDQMKLIPLFPEGNTVDQVTIEWFSRDDISASTTGAVDLPNTTTLPQRFAPQSNYPDTRPPVLRVQLMQYGTNFSAGDFDEMTPSESNTNTLFLYPTQANIGLTSAEFIGRDIRNTGSGTPADDPGNAPLPVRCEPSISAGGYACQMSLTLPDPIGGGQRTAYLSILPYYNATSFRVTMQQSSQPVFFDGVQPAIDSTGRANDLFRRVSSRVDLIDTAFPYPVAALEVDGNICKTFAVTNTQYIAGTGDAACTP